MIIDYFFWIPLITYIVIIGEALALLLGMVIGKKQSIWNNRKNRMLLNSDILLGWSGILLIFLGNSNILNLFFVIPLMLSHAYRILEDTLKTEVPFCFNQPLYLVNLAKFIGLIIGIYLFII